MCCNNQTGTQPNTPQTIPQQIQTLNNKVNQIICMLGGEITGGGGGGTIVETDPTVPNYVKAITEIQIANWNGNDGGIWVFPV